MKDLYSQQLGKDEFNPNKEEQFTSFHINTLQECHDILEKEFEHLNDNNIPSESIEGLMKDLRKTISFVKSTLLLIENSTLEITLPKSQDEIDIIETKLYNQQNNG